MLSGHSVDFKEIDIADPTYEEEKKHMLENSKPNGNGLILPPQIFNKDQYCGVIQCFNIIFSPRKSPSMNMRLYS